MNTDPEVESDFVEALRGGRQIFEAEEGLELVEKEKEQAAIGVIVAILGTLIIAMVMLWLFLFQGCGKAFAEEYTDETLVEAIFLAEGGDRAKPYYYGVRSVRCETKDECRRICRNTVRLNRKRFADYGHRRFDNFLEFLGSRYCPVVGKNLSSAEKKLNKHWVKNVEYFLSKAKVAK